MYEQLQILKRNFPMMLVGIVSGSVTCIIMVLAFAAIFRFDSVLLASLLPKSITTAMGMVLSEQNGGIAALTTVVIIVTGILGSLIGPALCKLLRLRDPISQGVALGTASHVVGTSKAMERSAVAGAASSLSLVVAGLLTAVVLPLITPYL
jgi:putative effector of murein hydrolase